MKTHKLDIRKSEEIFNAYEDKIKLKDCYRNIYRVAVENFEKFKEGTWKIAYGFLPCFDLYVRHCFIVDETGNAIDPTVIAIQKETGNKPHSKDYISFAILSYDEYWKLLRECDYYPDLCRSLQSLENQLREETDLILIG